MSKTVNLIDLTLRDAHQCLWATRMTTGMMRDVAPLLDRAGFEAIDLVGGAVFDVCVRYLHEDPWERLADLRERILIAGLMLDVGEHEEALQAAEAVLKEDRDDATRANLLSRRADLHKHARNHALALADVAAAIAIAPVDPDPRLARGLAQCHFGLGPAPDLRR